ncbi:hypothetical protein AN948_32720 [Rhodococcus sp. ADH]|nr:hypothetical protein AN948_32720 [Rhodococcus sp. ADH]
MSAVRSVAWTRRIVAGLSVFGLRRAPFAICASASGLAFGFAMSRRNFSTWVARSSPRRSRPRCGIKYEFTCCSYDRIVVGRIPESRFASIQPRR